MNTLKNRILALLLAVTLCMGMAMTTASAADGEIKSLVTGALFKEKGAPDILSTNTGAFVSACLVIDLMLSTDVNDLNKIDFSKSFYIAPYEGNGLCVDMWFPTTSGTYSCLFYGPYTDTIDHFPSVYSSAADLLAARPYQKAVDGMDVLNNIVEISGALSGNN